MTNDHIHTCSPRCDRPACVAARGFPPLPEADGFIDSDGDFHGAPMTSSSANVYSEGKLRAYVLADRAAQAAEPVAIPAGYKLVKAHAYGQDCITLVAPDGRSITNAYEQGAPEMFAFLNAFSAPQPAQRDGEREALRRALVIAEAALSDIGDADREPGDDLAWCERRAAQDLPAIRDALNATKDAS